MNPDLMSNHQRRVQDFMQKAGQALPPTPVEPPEDVRLLRAKLIFEEALETINALGVQISLATCGSPIMLNQPAFDEQPGFEFNVVCPSNIVLVADGCADISVVTIGTLLAYGIPDHPILEAVDESNLAKFGPGHWKREDGKLMKSSDWQPPDLAGILQKLAA